jgi:hypothetical protein
MEHSIGKLDFTPFGGKAQICIDGRVAIEVCGDRRLEIQASYTQARERAEFVVTACNEHDTLKAKAELLDEAVITMGNALSDLDWIEHEAPDSNFQSSILALKYILSEAKELL